MADIFVSYTSDDRDWAFWIGQELLNLGHTAHVHEWEIPGGGDIAAWMVERHDKADHILLVASKTYFGKPYSGWEWRAAQWAAQTDRPNFALPVKIEDCGLPTLLASIKYCDLHGVSEDEARARFATFMRPAAKPIGPIPFPVGPKPSAIVPTAPVAFPGGHCALSNIPISVPRHFLGRDGDFAAIDAALGSNNGHAAVTALFGLRGVGKTTMAAAYAERHSSDYRATWWIRAETESAMRADLVGLGVRLKWVAADEKEEPALAAVMDRLRREGERILLVYDNANNAGEIGKYLPGGGAARIIVTSNAPDWRGIAVPVEIGVWPCEVGADYLIQRTGPDGERSAAVTLSEALGGLPLAHEQAAAYCERLGISLAKYHEKFAAMPGKYLDDARAAPAQYHNGLTVAKTFALAIDEAARLHPAAESLIVYAALLAPVPIPLFLFSEAREAFGEPLASTLADDGLDEAVATLRAFALIERETIADDRDPSITTDCIRLHRLVREVAAARCQPEAREQVRRAWIEAVAARYGANLWRDPDTWPLAARLDALALGLVGGSSLLPAGSEKRAADLLIYAGQYKQFALAAYTQARPLYERALAIREKLFGPAHPETADALGNLGTLLSAQGDFAGARPLYEHALAIREKALGPDHPDTAESLNNLGALLQSQGDLTSARPYFERTLTIYEKVRGPDHPNTASALSNLGHLLQAQGDLAGALPLAERALAIRKKAFALDHPDTATSLNNLGNLLQQQGDLAGARQYYTQALAMYEKTLGPDHPTTAMSRNNLGTLLSAQGDLAGARPYYERALAIREKFLGPDHRDTALALNNLGSLLQEQGDLAGARPDLERALAIYEKALGPDHQDTAMALNNLGSLLQEQGDLAGARSKYERALAIYEKALGPDHQDTALPLNNLGNLLQEQGDLPGARPYFERALAILEKTLGTSHPSSKTVARNTARLLEALECGDEAEALRRKFGVEDREKG